MPTSTFNPPAPSGRVPIWGLLLILAGAAGTAIGVGWLYHMVRHVGDVLVFGPLAAGLLVGISILVCQIFARCRNPRLLMVIGLVSGLAALFCLLYFDGRDLFESEIAFDIAKDHDMSAIQAIQAAKELRERSGLLGTVTTFIHSQANNEVTIEGTHYDGHLTTSPFSGRGFYLSLAVKMLMMAGIPAFMCSPLCYSGYCETCGRWLKRTDIGKADLDVSEALIAAVKRHDMKTVGKLQRPYVSKTSNIPYLHTVVQWCSGCGEGWIEVNGIPKSDKRVPKEPLIVEPLQPSDMVRKDHAVNTKRSPAEAEHETLPEFHEEA